MKGNNRKTKVLCVAAAVLMLAALVIGCKPNVSTPKGVVTGVTLNQNALTLVEGKTGQLTATVTPANATNKKVTWSSDKPEVAEVDQNGKVTAKTVGTAKITVKTEDGSKTAECSVTVTVPKYQISFAVDGGHGTLKAKADGITETDASPLTVEKGKTVTFTATANADYEVKGWTNNGKPIAEAGTDSTYTHTVTVAADIKVTFKALPPADKTYTVGSVNFTMKGIDAVTNGIVGHDDYNDKNKPHTVSLSAYLIGETEVTQELWKNVMGDKPSNFKDSMKNPVEQVSWYECIAFCNELTKKVNGLGEAQSVYYSDAGKTNVYTKDDAENIKIPVMDMSKKGFRLPTEAEWEWAAMGGKDYKWAGTNDEGKLKDYAWYYSNSGLKTHEVKKKLPNGYGLYDMSGNVWEWCWDRSGSLSGVLAPDYEGAGSGNGRVVRGGSWDDDAGRAPRAFRNSHFPEKCFNLLGLRLVSRP